MGHSDDMRGSVAGLLEAASRTLAPTKVEMEVYIENELQLSARGGAGGPAYLDELRRARRLLNDSPDLPTFLRALHDEISGATTSPAELATHTISTMIAGWALLIAILVAGIAGFLVWPWWIAGLVALTAAFAREIELRFQMPHMDRGFYARSMLMVILLVLMLWGLGRGLSLLLG